MNVGAIGAALEKLGATADDVAFALRNMGIKGHRANPLACPLAEYLCKEFGMFSKVWPVRPPHVWRCSVADSAEGVEVRADLPEACAKFVTRFDDRCYPDLDIARAKDGTQ